MKLPTISQQGLRRAKWAAIALTGFVLLIAVLGFWVLPPWIKSQAESAASEALGRRVSIERIEMNPFALRITVLGVRIAEAQGDQAFVSLGRVYADAQISSVLRGGAVLRELVIEQPEIRIERLPGERFNYSDILERLAEQAKKTPATGEAVHYALNNIQLSGGRLRVFDRVESTSHDISEITLRAPFLSTIEDHEQIFVEPLLAARVNGTPFRLTGRARPFADSREAELDIRLQRFELAPYLTYLPPDMPVQLAGGSLEVDMKAVWVQPKQGAQSLDLRGKLVAHDIRLQGAKQSPLLQWRGLAIHIAHLQPLAKPLQAEITRIEMDGAVLDVLRDKAGHLNLASLGGTPDTPAAQTAPAVAASASAAAKPSDEAAARVRIDEIVLRDAAVSWRDEAVPGNYGLRLTPLNLSAKGLNTASGSAPAQITLTAGAESGERLQYEGVLGLTPLAGSGSVTIEGVALERLRPYYAAALPKAAVRGVAQAQLKYSLTMQEQGLSWQIQDSRVGVKSLEISPLGSKQSLIRLAELSADGLAVVPEKHAVNIGRVASRNLRVRALRDDKGELDVLRMLLAQAPTSAPADAPPAAEQASSPAPAWIINLARTELRDWAVHFEDRSGRDPVALDVSNLSLDVQGLSTRPDSSAKIDLKARINKDGKLAVAGDLGLQPLRGELNLAVDDVDIVAIQPHIDQHFKVLITDGALSLNGKLGFDLSRPDAPQAKFAGNALMAGFNSLDLINDTDFLRWKSFGGSGIEAQLSPLSISMREVVLQDFYTRLILDAQGRFNLRELAGTAEASEQTAAGPAVTTVSPAGVQTTAPAPAPTEPLPPIRIDRIVIEGGDVNFSDRFVKPNYDARVTSLVGKVEGLSSAPDTVATLALNGNVDGSAPLVIDGKLNPLRQDRYLDIRTKVTGVDLTGASTYSGKFLGYGITRGRLSLDLAYQIRDRKLTATNQVVLNQLSFGERVDSPEATKLPVMLAVALLRDRNGDIDINLPIGGSLDDPEFSVGGIVIKVLINLITKAITSPFALLGSLVGGGGEELSMIEFRPGLAVLDEADEKKLQALSRALTDRPALRLDISGRADAQTDAAGVRRDRMMAKLRALKAQVAVKRGESVRAVDQLQISPTEYPGLLTEVYRAEPMDKRRNVLGIHKTVPVEEMESRLQGNIKLSEADYQNLARARAQNVRNWLIEQGKIAADRLFIVNAGETPSGENKAGSSARVDFSLK